MTQYETIKVDISDKIGTITLAPGPMNPLSSKVMKDVTAALAEFDASDDVRAIIITGDGDKAFAAGADIKLSLIHI